MPGGTANGQVPGGNRHNRAYTGIYMDQACHLRNVTMKIHIVRPGDTAQSIAREWNMPLWLLLKVNGLTDQKALVEGQTLLLLFPETESSAPAARG